MIMLSFFLSRAFLAGLGLAGLGFYSFNSLSG